VLFYACRLMLSRDEGVRFKPAEFTTAGSTARRNRRYQFRLPVLLAQETSIPTRKYDPYA
jgi:hypothetical protein